MTLIRLPTCFISLVLVLLLFGCFPSSETPEIAPICDERVERLLISVSIFPDGWFTERTSRPRTHLNAIHRCGRGFSVLNGVANYSVYEYKNVSEAKNSFDRQQTRFFRDDEYHTVWQVPNFAYDIDISAADEYYLACRSRSEGVQEFCQLLAVYGQFTVRFHTYMFEESMTDDDFIKIVQVIDSFLTGVEP